MYNNVRTQLRKDVHYMKLTKPTKYEYRRNGEEVDKEQFANLVVRAKGNNSISSFAELCGVQPSTFTRIIRGENKGASSPALLEAIADNAAEGSNVTIEKLAEANGYSVSTSYYTSIFTQKRQFEIEREHALEIILDELKLKNASVAEKYNFLDCSLRRNIVFDKIIETDVFEHDTLLAIDYFALSDLHRNIYYRTLEKLGTYMLAAANINRNLKFWFVVSNEELFAEIIRNFGGATLTADVSVILVDFGYNRVMDEFQFSFTTVRTVKSPNFFIQDNLQ